MKMRRFVSLLIGLLLIALMVYKFVTIDRESVIIYHEIFPKMVNTIIYYALFAIKVITILLIAVGSKKTLIASLFLLPIVVAYNLDWSMFDKHRVIVQNESFNALIETFGNYEYFYFGVLLVMVVYWLLLIVFVLSKGIKKIVPKTILMILGLAPIILYYVYALFISEVEFTYEKWETIRVITDVGVMFFITVMLLFSQKGTKKVQAKHIWFPAIETI